VTMEIDYQGATSFVALIRGIQHWHDSAEWPDYLVADITMVEHAEDWLPDGVVVLEWQDTPSDDEPRSCVLGKPR